MINSVAVLGLDGAGFIRPAAADVRFNYNVRSLLLPLCVHRRGCADCGRLET